MTADAATRGAAGQPPLIRIRELTKTFPGLRALDAVSLDVHAREIVAVVGQNGSGKSTLVKILAGVHAADSGTVDVRGPDGETLGGATALEHLHFIHQDLGLIPTLSTIENLDLGSRLGRRALLPLRARRERRAVQELTARFGEPFDVELPVARLSAAEQRIVAIARALSGWRQPDNVLVLDEPTVALPATEVQRLFGVVRRVAREGAGILFISHRLDEVLDLANRIIVLRDGRLVADAESAAVDHDELVRLITGRQLAEARLGRPPGAGAPILSARHLAGASVLDASLELSPGEIVGVGGIVGSGQEHVAGLLFGSLCRTGGEVHVAGEPLAGEDPVGAIRRGLAFIPADRRAQGAVMEMYARENLTLPGLGSLRRRGGRLDRGAEREEAWAWSRRVALSPADPERPLNLFSGGNQQKVVLAKWLRVDPQVLLLDEPTQGVDVGAKAAIYELIAGAARSGTAVLVTSSDSKELAQLCDRVLVMRDGRVEVSLGRSELNEPNLVSASLGMRRAELGVLFGGGAATNRETT